MRTFQVDAARGFRGGEKQVLALAKGLAARAHPTWIVAAPGSELLGRSRAAGLSSVALPLAGGWDLYSAVRLANEARRRRVQAIHVHDAHSLTVGGLAARWTGVPLVLSRRVDFPLSRWGVFRYRRWPERILAVSRRVAELLSECGVPAHLVRVVHDGVDVDAIRAAGGPAEILRARGLAPGAVYVGNVAALTDHKGQRYLIEAARRIRAKDPRPIFLIAGEGELRPELERLVDAEGLRGTVVFLGFIPDVERLYGALSVFVMSSHLEGFGSAVLEAMAAGVPVVTTEAGGLREIVEHGVDGLVVPPRNPEALADAVLRLLGNPTLARRCAEAAREKVAARFGIDRMIERTIEVYRELT